MKQYTYESQTAKLVGLGFAPKMRITRVNTRYGIVNVENEVYFDVGKLIEMLPKKLDTATDDTAYLEISWDNIGWRVDYVYFGFFLYTSMAIELIDALYDMVVKLKEKAVI